MPAGGIQTLDVHQLLRFRLIQLSDDQRHRGDLRRDLQLAPVLGEEGMEALACGVGEQCEIFLRRPI